MIKATVDPRLEPVLFGLVPLVFRGGASPADDVGAHVRAASALRRRGARLVILQDDVNALAVHAADGVERVLLPVGPGGLRTFDDLRGNKADKMDLEACARLPDGRLVAFGSGSTPAREQLVIIETSGGVRVIDAADLYARLRGEPRFAGSELNVEGAIVAGDALRLFQRGNGAITAETEPVNATGDLPLEAFVAWLDSGAATPSLTAVVQYDLGQAGGARFTFTDAALLDDGRVAFLACAEASPDAVRDGPVVGARFGIIEGDGARIAGVRDRDGALVTLKLEGLEPSPDSPRRFDVVADMDRPGEPALLGVLEIRG